MKENRVTVKYVVLTHVQIDKNFFKMEPAKIVHRIQELIQIRRHVDLMIAQQQKN